MKIDHIEDSAQLAPRDIAARIARELAPDIVDVLNTLEAEEATDVVAALPRDKAVEVLDQPALEHGPAIIEGLPRDAAAAILALMSLDRVVDLFHDLDEPVRKELTALLAPEARQSVQELLAYPEDSAGAIMTTEFVSVPSTWSIAEVLHHIRMVERSRETVYAVYVMDPARNVLVQAVSLRRLVAGDPHASVLTAAPQRKPVSVRAAAPRSEAVRLISKYDLLAVPVVDGRGHILGIVTVDDVIDAMVQRQTEEVQRFGGMEALDEPYTEISFWRMVQKRAGWLCALFFSEMLTASAMQGYENELAKAVVLTLFIPLIMSSGGNSGSQATSLLIRAIALQQVRLKDWWRVALRELPAGLVLGGILGIIGIVRITTWQMMGLYNYGEHWRLLALTVGLTLVGVVTFGSVAGSLLPFVLKRAGFDPAAASAPFVATLVDVTGLIIYFSVAALILRGTLL